MRIIGKIMIIIALLCTTLYGGGVCIAHCACSGAESIYNLGDDTCCPKEEGCMTVIVVQLTDEYPAAHLNMPDLVPLVVETAFGAPVATFKSPILLHYIDSKSPPCWPAQYNMVMTV